MADQEKKPRGITSIAVSGFKSLRDETRIDIRPLTVLAGANSSGKSSIMQPLLMLKQTLDSPNDPGALLINGQNVNFSKPEEFLSISADKRQFIVSIELDRQTSLTATYAPNANRFMDVTEVVYQNEDMQILRFTPTMQGEEIASQVPAVFEEIRLSNEQMGNTRITWGVIQNRGFLSPVLAKFDEGSNKAFQRLVLADFPLKYYNLERFRREIYNLIHLSGFRERFQREQPRTPVVTAPFAGTFEYYAASVIEHWFRQKSERRNQLIDHMKLLNLSDTISVLPSSTRIEIEVNRFPVSAHQTDQPQTVNIADVGFGVSQVLPVLVALLVAEPGQLVYIEQPELHLHPRAQVALAQVLADAANRGVRVVIETHSDLVLLGIQTLVAENKLAPENVIFHWFKRDDEGCTKVTPTDLDEMGAYVDDFPEDFAEVEFRSDSRYLDAVGKRRVGQE